MAYNFSHITATTIAAADRKPGHSDVLRFCPMEDFLVIAKPVGPFTDPGSKKTIAAAHTHSSAAKAFVKIQLKANSVEGDGEAVGEAGGLQAKYNYKFVVKGHSAVIEEQLEELLNTDGIFLFNSPECAVDSFVQLGSECSPAQVKSFAPKTGSKGAGGLKEYELSVTSNDKYYYTAAVTDRS